MLTFVETIDDVNSFWTWLSEQDRIAVDTETTGVDVFAPNFHIRLAQVGTRDRAWVFDFRRWYGVIDEMFKRFRGRLVMHNARYDVHAFAAEGITVPWHSLDDTMIALRLAEPNRPAGLKKASDRLLGQGSSGSQQDLHEAFRVNKWDWDTVPIDFPSYIFYAGMDVILTSRIAEHSTAARGFSSPVYGLEMEVRSLANIMERRGLKIDSEYSAEMSRVLRDEAYELRDRIQEKYGFMATSTQALGRWLMTNATDLMVTTTDSGAPSVDKEALQRVVALGKPDAVELAESVLRIRRAEKLASSYFDNFVELSDSECRLHPDIETLAARTGRMSIRKPGLQTLPRISDDPETRIVRRGVIPREEGHVLIACDSDQIELRLAAALSNDAAMIEAFITSEDFFTQSVRDIYGDPSAVKSDSRRAVVKTFWYASLYGAGVNKMAESAGVSVARMREIKSGIESSYPDYSRLNERFEREARDNDCWVTNPYGRRLQVDEGREYTATNYIIQSTAADVLKKSIVDLGHAGLEDYMVIPVHDELIFSVPEEDAVEIAHLVAEVMTNDDFPLTLTAGAGPPAKNWSEAK